jgi:hypothetical protein
MSRVLGPTFEFPSYYSLTIRGSLQVRHALFPEKENRQFWIVQLVPCMLRWTVGQQIQIERKLIGFV